MLREVAAPMPLIAVQWILRLRLTAPRRMTVTLKTYRVKKIVF